MSLYDVGDDTIIEIASYLKILSLARFLSTCKRFRDLSNRFPDLEYFKENIWVTRMIVDDTKMEKLMAKIAAKRDEEALSLCLKIYNPHKIKKHLACGISASTDRVFEYDWDWNVVLQASIEFGNYYWANYATQQGANATDTLLLFVTTNKRLDDKMLEALENILGSQNEVVRIAQNFRGEFWDNHKIAEALIGCGANVEYVVNYLQASTNCGHSAIQDQSERAWIRFLRKEPPDSDEEQSSRCKLCQTKFGFLNRRHTCRNCGGLVCNTCSQHKVIIPSLNASTPYKVCDTCYSSYV